VSLIQNLWTLYREKEAITTTVSFSVSDHEDEIQISDPYLFFDTAAFTSTNRQRDIHALLDPSTLPPTIREAQENGIVYIPLASPVQTSTHASIATQKPPTTNPSDLEPRNLIGTLVNGAGLAMNTNDVLHSRLFVSPSPTTSANFLDTGGKATAHTISVSFSLILSDPRVSVIFVNIFGGLTRCDMIAEGIIMAFKEVGVRKPVVVRLRGTNEERGQRVLAEAKLPIWVFDGFEEAVGKVGELVREERKDCG
jgi:succinyl-CoA synthetase alpha subunit